MPSNQSFNVCVPDNHQLFDKFQIMHNIFGCLLFQVSDFLMYWHVFLYINLYDFDITRNIIIKSVLVEVFIAINEMGNATLQ